ncbi:hypothetical protein VNO80_27499 [Phaseolus coccineus]|uniref:Uncharacterized protein n=1 Tax=Phaseolus coccineus TaxID=3886 RepID=A0AAN9LK64_PHACN
MHYYDASSSMMRRVCTKLFYCFLMLCSTILSLSRDPHGTSANYPFISVLINLDVAFTLFLFLSSSSLVLLVHFRFQVLIHYKQDNLISIAFRCNSLGNPDAIMMGFRPKLRHFSQFKAPQNTKYLNYEDSATQKGQTKLQLKMHVPHGQNYASAYSAIINQCFVSYVSSLCFFQAVAVSYAKQVVKLMVSLFMAGKGTDETNKELNTQKMGAP